MLSWSVSTHQGLRRLVLTAVLALFVMLPGCGGNGGTSSSNQQALVSITVKPQASSLPVGAQLQFSVLAMYDSGFPGPAQVTWSTSNNAIATINASGLATGVAPGTATVMATSGQISGNASLNVDVTPELLTITISPPSAAMNLPGSLQFFATGSYSDGSSKVLTSSATWTSSDTGVATIVSSGLATGVAAGSTTITATSGTVSGAANLAVN